MVGKSPITADGEQRAALRALAHSRDRCEADRARAMLLTLLGWTSPRIAEAFGVREDTVRLWRCDFADGGVEALKASVEAWPSPCEERGRAARRHASFGSSRRQPAQLDDRAPDQRDRGARGRPDRQVPINQDAAKKNFRWRRPQHSLKVARSPARSRAWACAFNCARAKPRPATSSCFMATKVRPRRTLFGAGVGQARSRSARAGAGTSQKSGDDRLARSSHAPVDRAHQPDQAQQRLHRSPGCQLDRLYGPQPGQDMKPVVLVEANGPIHVSRLALAALESAQALAHRRVAAVRARTQRHRGCLRDLKAHNLAHYTFTDAADLDRAIDQAVQALKQRAIS